MAKVPSAVNSSCSLATRNSCAESPSGVRPRVPVMRVSPSIRLSMAGVSTRNSRTVPSSSSMNAPLTGQISPLARRSRAPERSRSASAEKGAMLEVRTPISPRKARSSKAPVSEISSACADRSASSMSNGSPAFHSPSTSRAMRSPKASPISGLAGAMPSRAPWIAKVRRRSNGLSMFSAVPPSVSRVSSARNSGVCRRSITSAPLHSSPTASP